MNEKQKNGLYYSKNYKDLSTLDIEGNYRYREK